ncbi:kinase-like domain-containing protein [Coprinopsis sp. MPI-PUGE-AT-0042]|nr:kinase-like domain-containing protein [Coprinopsis sp. MPI-PUGE-AT-0042]
MKIVSPELLAVSAYLEKVNEFNAIHEFQVLDIILHLIDTFQIDRHSFFVFPEEGNTLRTVVDDPSVAPFSERQIKEIIRQIVEGLDYVHSALLSHGDLSPYTVIFPNPSTTEEIYYDEHDRFQSRNTLRSTQLKISWKGSTRDPKVLLGNEATLESDYFSLGCLMAELMLGRPLFLHSERKSYDYPQDTFLMMEHTIEAFPEQIPYSYRRAAKRLFADDGMVLRGPNIHPEVTHYLGTESLKNYSTHAKPGVGWQEMYTVYFHYAKSPLSPTVTKVQV